MICAAKGYLVKLCLPANASPERKQILKAFGAELVLTDAGEGSDGAIRVCKRIYTEDPDTYFYPDQYSNDANWEAHYETTGPEIIEQTGGSDHPLCGRARHQRNLHGNGAAFEKGVARRRGASPCNRPRRCTAWKAQSTCLRPLKPRIYDPALADDNLWVDTEDAYDMARKLARQEGLLVGISAAANVVAATRVAESLSNEGQSGVVVTILCDGGQKYLSEDFWND